jgi:hypothetical protein
MRKKGGNREEEHDEEVRICDELSERINEAFAKYQEKHPIIILCGTEEKSTLNGLEHSNVELYIQKKRKSLSWKDQTCFQAVIQPDFGNRKSRPFIEIGTTCSVYVKPCEGLSVSTVLAVLSPILKEYGIRNEDQLVVGDCSTYVYQKGSSDETEYLYTKILYNLRFNRSFYSYHLFGKKSNYHGESMTAIKDVEWEPFLPPRDSINNTAELGNLLKESLELLCKNVSTDTHGKKQRPVNEEGQAVCVVSDDNWELLLSLIAFSKKVHKAVFHM